MSRGLSGCFIGNIRNGNARLARHIRAKCERARANLNCAPSLIEIADDLTERQKELVRSRAA